MINPKELRLGNLVAFKHAPKGITTHHSIIRIEETTITLDGFESGAGKYRRDLEYQDVDGIELTPEWLERCGLKWDEEHHVHSIQVGHALYLEIDKDFDCAITPEHLPGGSLFTWSENKYVHQLQNLYYSLAGKELTKMPGI